MGIRIFKISETPETEHKGKRREKGWDLLKKLPPLLTPASVPAPAPLPGAVPPALAPMPVAARPFLVVPRRRLYQLCCWPRHPRLLLRSPQPHLRGLGLPCQTRWGFHLSQFQLHSLQQLRRRSADPGHGCSSRLSPDCFPRGGPGRPCPSCFVRTGVGRAGYSRQGPCTKGLCSGLVSVVRLRPFRSSGGSPRLHPPTPRGLGSGMDPCPHPSLSDNPSNPCLCHCSVGD